MASLDFEAEKASFCAFYDANRRLLLDAKEAFIRIIRSQLKRSDVGEVTKIEGRIKDREECIGKFHRKYQSQLEADEQPYEIRDFITDLIGIRIVCLYHDQIPLVSEMLRRDFRILDVTDKIAAVESTEDSFGYKGLHMDLALNDRRGAIPGLQRFADIPFEVQIRSLIQDAWSVLDHKIKYKKSIPVELKRRINVLSALFELVDREFREIRDATAELMQQASFAPVIEPLDEAGTIPDPGSAPGGGKTINAFNFLRVASHFFRDFDFEDYKVDDFVQGILKIDGGFQKSDLHRCLIENLKVVREYRDYFIGKNPDKNFSPYTSIRHCLYLYDKEVFRRILSTLARDRFTQWLKSRGE
ncbi:MAG TPA: (p)ppGpp synthetase [Verrucomicrobiae bacterium]|nr:(p)ppGpp synthetase [Verrucomicrobiae bacterium]